MAIGEQHSYFWEVFLIAIMFLLGVGNFFVHKAVLESRHPMLEQFRGFQGAGRRVSLAFEFVVLVACMLLAAQGWTGAVIAYAIYSSFNFGTAWLILSGRI
ncbi:hypothetical protein [Qipengyuania xiamenensis]|uniref:hypothetical protein n=1 Tax=Qipengyuania xiamenensis TaxID=2867237 RepID=UPI001FFD145B|nr:hypothetical protein [Qipengyuania xiamenensis]